MKLFFPVLCSLGLSFLIACSMSPDKSASRAPSLSEPFQAVSSSHLFSSHTPFQLQLSAPLTTIFQEKSAGIMGSDKPGQTGTLTYTQDGHQKKSVTVRIKLKGTTTLANCPFPKMELEFVSGTEGTPFASMKSVDFHTHCSEPNDTSVPEMFRASYFNHREALVYQMLEILEIPSLKARPVFVDYKDTDSPSSVSVSSGPYRAFFLEDLGDLRKRIGAKTIRDNNDPMKKFEVMKDPKKASSYQFETLDKSPKADLEDASRIALFQAMVGNGDWFLKLNAQHMRSPSDKTGLWNTKIVENSKGKWVLFPQDFSLSAVVLASHFPILMKEVWEISSPASRERIKAHFKAKKEELYQAIPALGDDAAGKAATERQLDRFFSSLDNY